MPDQTAQSASAAGRPGNGPGSSGGASVGSGTAGGTDATGAGRAGGAADPFTPPTVTLPKGGGALRGLGEAFSVGAATGTASCTVPVATTAGRDGSGPALALRYDSGAGNGPYGLGWTLAVPAVTRKTDRVLPRYRDTDVFLLSDTEDLVAVLDNAGTPVSFDQPPWAPGHVVDRFRPRTEGMYARIERWRRTSDGDEHWRSISRDNVTTVYGSTPAARVADPAAPGRVYSWLAERTVDDRGNATVYEYKAEDSANVLTQAVHERHRTPAGRTAQRYLKRIRYGNRVSALTDPDLSAPDWAFEVVFDYGEHDPVTPTPVEVTPWPCRPDAFSGYKPGFEVRTYRLCRRVLMFHTFPGDAAVGTDCLVRATELGYAEDPALTLLTGVTSAGFRRSGGGYLRRALPPVHLDYSTLTWHDTVVDAGAGSVADLPAGLATAGVSHVDLDGEGIAGVLYTGVDGWFYGANTGGGRFAPLLPLPAAPAGRDVGTRSRRLLDVTATGTLDVVDLAPPTPGYYARADGDWAGHAPFTGLPTVDFEDPDLRLADLDGDGLADVLITGGDVLTWHASLGTGGFAPASLVPVDSDEETGPRLVFHDDTESIHLADMSGDGLSDLVRVRNGQVCYWPSLGYGRFGAKVTLDNSPLLAAADAFDPRYVRLADVDGTGTADLVYLDGSGARIWRNRAGNDLAPAHVVAGLPPAEDTAVVDVADLLGTGTACLVWSSPLPDAARRPLRYVDLLGGVKPYLLTGLDNNLGSVTRTHYVSSVQFLLADKAAGRPWVTRLPFPVHVVDRVDTYDRISRNWLSTRYAYHHGHFDAAEREFRGFGLVERWDADQIGVVTTDPPAPPPSGVADVDPAPSLPPVHTKTWYHTGVLVGGDTVSQHYAGDYWPENLTPVQAAAMLLADTVLPETLLRADGTRVTYAPTPAELRDAVRGLRGSMLREEVYALDGATVADRPYQVTECNYGVELLAPRGPNPHAVCAVHPRETLTMSYDRTEDPRASHELVLDVDGYGDVRTSVVVGYPRRAPVAVPGLAPADLAALHDAQARTWVRLTETDFTAPVDTGTAYRTPAPADARSYELVHLRPAANVSGVTNLFTFAELAAGVAAAGDGAHDLPSEDVDAVGAVTPAPYRRLVSRTRTVYRADDLSGPLPAGTLGALGLPYQRLRLAFTPSQLAELYTRNGTDLLSGSEAALAAEGGYTVDADGWWVPSDRVGLSPGAADPPATELAYARAHFFHPHRFTDPFGALTAVGWDPDDLVAVSVTDALGNQTAVTGLNHRVLLPATVTDPNGNRTAAVYDAIGRVAALAVMGKQGSSDGDSLSGVDPDPDDPTVAAFLADPLGAAAALLGGATSRFVYDLGAYQRTAADPAPSPVVAATLLRTRYSSDPQPAEVRCALDYSDGFGRLVQHKAQAAPGPISDGGSTVAPRWSGSGWTVFDNKGNPVRRYEPFFTATPAFQDARAVGVSVLACYDPLGRMVAVVQPDASYAKTVRDAWSSTTWDRNDTALLDPRTDPDVAGYLAAWAATLPGGWRTWYQTAATGDADAQDAAAKAAAHADTPAAGHTDPLGRSVMGVEHLRDTFVDELLATRSVIDVQANLRQAYDAAGRLTRNGTFDLLSRPSSVGAADAGVTYTLPDIAGQPMRIWNARALLTRVTYDTLRRPVRRYVTENGTERLRDRTVYGEAHPTPATDNLRGQVFRRLDGAGLAENTTFDFAGNPVRTSRRLASDHRDQPDWSAAAGMTDLALATSPPPGVETTEYATVTVFDAMRRPVQVITADASVTRPHYTEADLLGGVDVRVRGAGPVTPMVTGIDYNARGQRAAVGFGNGATTSYRYDPMTFRITDVTTGRPAPGAVQALRYHYDAEGNVTRRADGAQQTTFYAGAVVDAGLDLTVDSLYRLTAASGREHIGQAGDPAPDWNDAARSGLPLPTDGQAMRRYAEAYAYDTTANLTSVTHQATAGNWTRTYTYTETSALRPAEKSNRLTSTTVGAVTEAYAYDPHGNLTQTARLASIDWDDRDLLRVADLGGGGTFYAHYDAGSTRARKVVERQNGTRQYEWIYLAGLDIYREYDGTGDNVTLERQTLHVHDGEHRFALVETRTQGTDPGLATLTRYQFADHLDSACVELDENAAVVSYEEYYPFGGTSLQSVRATTETPKRYRYTARERDRETGFTYHGARYCAPWLGRWIAVDPAGSVDGLNPYAYVRNNPMRLADPRGTDGEDKTHDAKARPGAAKPTTTTPTPAGTTPTAQGQTAKATPAAPAAKIGQDAAKDDKDPSKPEREPDQVNLWTASMIQLSGVITKGKLEKEAWFTLTLDSQHGLGASRPHLGGGLSNIGAAFRYQIAAIPGLDVGGTLSGSVIGQGSDSGSTTTRGGALNGTVHWGAKSSGGFGIAFYGNGGGGLSVISTGQHTTGFGGQGLLALSYERDPTDGFAFTSIGVNAIGGGSTTGGLSQGPNLTGLRYAGGTVGITFGLGKQWGITAEANVTQTAGDGDKDAPGQSASSTTWRAGVVANYSWGPYAPTAGGLGIGVWGQNETGSVTGPTSGTSSPGNFSTNSVIFGFSIGGRGNRLFW